MSTSSSKTFILPAAGRVFVTQPSASGSQEGAEHEKTAQRASHVHEAKKGLPAFK